MAKEAPKTFHPVDEFPEEHPYERQYFKTNVEALVIGASATWRSLRIWPPDEWDWDWWVALDLSGTCKWEKGWHDYSIW